MIVRINRYGINACGTNQRIIRYYIPGGHVATAVGRFPYPTPNRSQISHDAAVNGCHWIDCNRVYPPLSGCVVETIEASGHALRLRTERGKTGRVKGIWTSQIEPHMV